MGHSTASGRAQTVLEGARLEAAAYREFVYWGNGKHDRVNGTVTMPDGKVVTEEEHERQMQRITNMRINGVAMVNSVIGTEGRLRVATKQSTLAEEAERNLNRRRKKR